MTVRDFLNHKWNPGDDLKIRCIAGESGLDNEIVDLNINRPGLSLAGYNIEFGAGRIQLFGRGEYSYLLTFSEKQEFDSIINFFKNNIPCTLFANNTEPPKFFIKLADQFSCPILQTEHSSATVTRRLSRAFTAFNTPSQLIHAVLVEVFGVGVLLIGESGIGKSETALALIERGHLLISDDAVKIILESGKTLVGSAPNPELGYHMEIRGLGIINIPLLFGVGVVRDHKMIEMVIELERWDYKKQYDRIGGSENANEYFGVKIPKVLLPVRAGRSIPVIIETAVRNFRLQSMGYNAGNEFKKIIHTSLAENTQKQNQKAELEK